MHHDWNDDDETYIGWPVELGEESIQKRCLQVAFELNKAVPHKYMGKV